jgi:hypothetical protein
MTPARAGRRILALVALTDFRQCFRPEILLPLAFLVPVGIVASVTRGDLSPATVVVLVSFGVLDRQFNALLSRSTSEWEALTLLPVPWGEIVLGKNIATIAAWLFLVPVVGSVILYFPVHFPPADEFRRGALLAWTVIFPLLIVGNIRSIQEPRREPDSIARTIIMAAGMSIFAILCTVPYILLTTLGGSEPLSVLYGALGALVWWRWSVPNTALRAQTELEHS